MPGSKKTTVTAEVIAEFLNQTGFVFEMRMNEAFSKHGYTCEISPGFRDLEGDTEREIDLVASKVLNNINIHFVVECKQSALDKWIFICTKGSGRFYYSVKHLPSVSVEILKDKKLFSHFHTFDPKIPLAHNYLSYSLATNKKTDHLQIDECVHKLPKASIDIASRAEYGRHLFFPVALFSGQLFAVNYKASLLVEEKPFLQYSTEFASDAYKEAKSFRVMRASDSMLGFDDWEESLRRGYDESIRRAARNLASHYQIDFVAESGLSEYIAMVEREVNAVRTNDWPLPDSNAKPAAS